MKLDNGYIYKDKITRFGMAPGYRDMSFHLHLNKGDEENMETVKVKLDKETVDDLLRHIIDIYGVSTGYPSDHRPIDFDENESSKTKERFNAIVDLYKKGLG